MADLPVKHDSNEDIFRGQLFLFVDDQPIAYAKTAALNVTSTEVDVSNKMMGGWEASLYGKNGYTISSDSLYTQKEGQLSYDALLDKLIKKETVSFFLGQVIKTEETNTGGKFAKDLTKKNYTGTAMITSLDLTSDDGEIATCSTSLKGVGALVPNDPVAGG